MSMHKGLIGKSEGGGSVKPTYEDKTLGDYINRKQRQDAFDAVAKEKKLTFEEWLLSVDRELSNFQCLDEYTGSCWSMMEMAWNAAQENK